MWFQSNVMTLPLPNQSQPVVVPPRRGRCRARPRQAARATRRSPPPHRARTASRRGSRGSHSQAATSTSRTSPRSAGWPGSRSATAVPYMSSSATSPAARSARVPRRAGQNASTAATVSSGRRPEQHGEPDPRIRAVVGPIHDLRAREPAVEPVVQLAPVRREEQPAGQARPPSGRARASRRAITAAAAWTAGRGIGARPSSPSAAAPPVATTSTSERAPDGRVRDERRPSAPRRSRPARRRPRAA